MNDAAQTWIIRNADTAEPVGDISGHRLRRYVREVGIVTVELLAAGIVDEDMTSLDDDGNLVEIHEGRNSGIVSGDEYGHEGINIYCTRS